MNKALARLALLSATRLSYTISDIVLCPTDMSEANASVTLGNAYRELKRITHFLDSLPKPPGYQKP